LRKKQNLEKRGKKKQKRFWLIFFPKFPLTRKHGVVCGCPFPPDGWLIASVLSLSYNKDKYTLLKKPPTPQKV
jgi:hypothetical protein